MTIKVTKLIHVGVRVALEPSAIEAARDTYCDLLGFADDDSRPKIDSIPGFWSNIGEKSEDLQVHIFGANGRSPAARTDREDPTRPHLAFGVESLEAAKRELESRGIEYWIFGGLVGPNSEQLFFEDGCGNMIELQQS